MSVSRETSALWNSVSRETSKRLNLYVEHLLAWNERINLISKGDVAAVWHRHIADSLQLLPLLPQAPTSWIDLGSGAGLPGLVLSLASDRPVTLIESDRRKAVFLREAARLTQTPATVICARIADATVSAAGLVTARALAPLSKLLDWSAPHCAPDCMFLFPKGENAEAEIADAQRHWTMRIERHISQTSPGGIILRISEVARA